MQEATLTLRSESFNELSNDDAKNGGSATHLKRFCSPQEMTAKGSELPSKLAPIRYLAESSSS